MKYCGLVIDDNCFEQDGAAATFTMMVEAEAKRHIPRLLMDLMVYGTAITNEKGERVNPLEFFKEV